MINMLSVTREKAAAMRPLATGSVARCYLLCLVGDSTTVMCRAKKVCGRRAVSPPNSDTFLRRRQPTFAPSPPLPGHPSYLEQHLFFTGDQGG